MKWYDLRQHALMSRAERMRGDDAMWRSYMRMLASGRRPDWPAKVFNGWVPKDRPEAKDAVAK